MPINWEDIMWRRAVERRNVIRAMETAMEPMTVQERYEWFLARCSNLQVERVTETLNASKLTT